jgi:plastocyanin
MKRLGLAALGVAVLISVASVIYVQSGASGHGHVQAAQTDEGGPLANATVSFGGWMTTPAMDRFPNNSPIMGNHHALTPQIAKIKAGGTVNFIIGGFHHVLVYDDGTQPDDIDTTITIPPTNGGPPLIADPDGRIYRGLDPSLFPTDRVEVVQFSEPGTYLVLCGVAPHFADGMFGFVRVIPNPKDMEVK